MMNRLSRNSRLAITVGLVVAGSLVSLPSVPVAAMSTGTPKTSPFCTNLAAYIAKVDGNVASVKSKLVEARAKRDQAIGDGHAKWDQELKTNRDKWDQQRQVNFMKLEANAKTPARLAAVKTYEASITSAINARRTANDAARASYRSSVNDMLGQRRSTADTQVSTFTSAVAAAESAAQSGCQSTPSNGPSLRATFQLTLKSAREAYGVARKSNGQDAAQVKQLASTREAAFKASEATFTAAAKAARDALKAAFGSTSV